MNSCIKIPRLLSILLLALACATGVMAQDAGAPASSNTPAEPKGAESKATPPAPAPSAGAVTAKPNTPTPESFTPSEEISEDLSVSFPVDI